MIAAAVRAVAAACLVSVFSAGWNVAGAETITGVVVGVADGDTVTALDEQWRQHKITLAGIDAPEQRQDFGNRSKQSLSDLAHRRQVVVETGTTDRYGRAVGKLLVGGQDVNLEHVRRGMAWHYAAYDREQPPLERQVYAAAEDAAKQAGRGLWAAPRTVPPWEFRRRRSEGSVALPRRPGRRPQSAPQPECRSTLIRAAPCPGDQSAACASHPRTRYRNGPRS